MGKFSSVRALLSNRDFRSLCASQLLAGLGEWLATMALIALVYAKTHSTLASGLVLIFRIAPAALFGTLLGSIVDRLDRRTVMVICNAGRALVYAALPFVGGTPSILVLALVAEVATIAYMTARDATLPRLVPKESLPMANAISMGSAYGMMPVGAGMYALFGFAGKMAATYALGAAGITLAVATLLVGRVTANVCGRSEKQPKIKFVAGLKALHQVFREDPILSRVAFGALIAAAGGGAVIFLGMGYVRETLHAGPSAFAGLLVSFCTGACVGVLSLQKLRSKLHHVFHAGVGLMGFILVLMAIFPSTPVGMVMSFLFGGAFVATFLGGITILQDRVRDSMRGQAFGLAHSVLRGGTVLVGAGALALSKVIGSAPRSFGMIHMDGNQFVLGAAGLLLFASATTLLRPVAKRLTAQA
ncbi:MAG: MFS transporter [Actinomycetota bacterium]